MARVPELAAKKAARATAQAAQKAVEAAQAKKTAKDKRRVIFRKAADYVTEYRAKERDLVRLRREARAARGLRVDDEPKLAFAVRLRGLNKVHPKTQKILQLLRLRQLGNGVFLQLNKSTLGLLKRVEPYVAWGYPNLATVRALVLKRGHAKVNGSRVPLTDNKVIEDALGDQGLICVEDLIHEIATVGPNFKAATNFLWPFKLSSPRGGLGPAGGKRTGFTEGGQAGNHGERIGTLLKRMI